MQSTIDKFGRVVIPKKIRESEGLLPGTPVDIESGDGEVRICPVVEESALKRVNGRLVHTGKFPDDFDLTAFIKQQRHERAEKVAGMELEPE